MSALTPPPLSLYIHVPWCVRKCPYCDFNSHEKAQALPETAYVDALIEDLQPDLHLAQDRTIESVFIGGGTPSLFSGEAYQRLFDLLRQQLHFSANCEITLEANPGTVEQERFLGYREAGINRLSLGVQSFQNRQLEKLGRIHNSANAVAAVHTAREAGFERINIDLMHGLPDQTTREAVSDIKTALQVGASHLSWYQLTIEPNTHFHKQPPLLPVEDTLADIQQCGLEAISEAGLKAYEVSAYAIPGEESRHNLNYWRFGDYLALGAGAHGKISMGGSILRYQKTRLPEHYLQRAGSRTAQQHTVNTEDLPFEYLMNALRLHEGFTPQHFEARTGLPFSTISGTVHALYEEGLLEEYGDRFRCTETGRRFLDDVVARFLP
ncbi:oxygen-independent coproporphyrinogen-3 oxidase [Litorivivens lipolytica]|uniref:Heme chaperone HemW n=1 Tax=Litorivivens lipolytica TaxID=1524264 RepID=A0A7W4W6K1_9GAMM|nr:oxygen-independent coproporphyrinogen-3 oxidase [Litorivivens lipolytica]